MTVPMLKTARQSPSSASVLTGYGRQMTMPPASQTSHTASGTPPHGFRTTANWRAALLIRHHPQVVGLQVGHVRLHRLAHLQFATPPVRPPPGIQSPASSYADDGLAGFRCVDCLVQLRVEDALTAYPADDRDWFDAWRSVQSSLAVRESNLFAHIWPRHAHLPIPGAAPIYAVRSPSRSRQTALL